MLLLYGLVALPPGGCSHNLETVGKPCTTHAECPATQRCGAAMRCVVGTRDSAVPDAMRADLALDAPRRDLTPDGLRPDLTPDAPGPDLAPDAQKGDWSPGTDLSGTCKTLVYVPGVAQDGKFGGRTGLDLFCATHKPSSLTCSSVHALVAVSQADALTNLAKNHGFESKGAICWVHSVTGLKTVFATDWADMLDGTILVSREVGTSRAGYAWIGTGQTGTVSTTGRFSCQGWTTNAYSTIKGDHWNFSYWGTANIGSGSVGMADATTAWLNTQSPFAKKKKLGPTTCCGYNKFACPTPCPPDSFAFYDQKTCGGKALLMCACAVP